jgi:hypothetical protein
LDQQHSLFICNLADSEAFERNSNSHHFGCWPETIFILLENISTEFYDPRTMSHYIF